MNTNNPIRLLRDGDVCANNSGQVNKQEERFETMTRNMFDGWQAGFKIGHQTFWMQSNLSAAPEENTKEWAEIMKESLAAALSRLASQPSIVEGKEEVFDKLITRHIEKMWGGLEMASVQYFMDTGKVNGSFRLRLIAMLKFYEFHLDDTKPKFHSSDWEIDFRENYKHLKQLEVDEIVCWIKNNISPASQSSIDTGVEEAAKETNSDGIEIGIANLINALVYYSQIHTVRGVCPVNMPTHEQAWKLAQRWLYKNCKANEYGDYFLRASSGEEVEFAEWMAEQGLGQWGKDRWTKDGSEWFTTQQLYQLWIKTK